MSLYQPAQQSPADSRAMANSLAAVDRVFEETFGTGILSGMTLSSAGAMSSGKVLAGHILVESGQSLSAKFAGLSGSFDLYAAVPVFAQAAGAAATVGSYPDATGADAVRYIVVPSGSGAGVTPAALIATVAVSGGTITAVNNAPSGRVNIMSPGATSATVSRLLRFEAVFPGSLSAPLPVPLAFLVPTPLTITGILAAVLTAPTGQAIIIKVQKNGTDVWSSANRPQIAAGATSVSNNAPDGAVTCAVGDVLTVDLTQTGSSVPGSTLLANLSYQLA